MISTSLDNGAYESANDTFRAEFELRKKLREDYPFYAAKVLKIRPKDVTKAGLVPFVLNDAQQYLHKRLEDQTVEVGMVRALILKGRQQGCSTYVSGRYYHKTTHNKGVRTYILTHEQDATANLFDIVNRFHENNFPQLKPYTAKSNTKELVFSKLDSGYRVGTAGTKAKGRSNTVQLFHGSEVAFWAFAEEHTAGIFQTVPKAPGTEIILETTANGMGNFFHRTWVKAVKGESIFIPIFIPWYWQLEYRAMVPPEFSLDPEDREYMELYELDLEQMVWRRNKTRELNNDPLLFKQEYPATPDEAFLVTGVDSFIKPEPVVRARKAVESRSYGAVIAAFDPKRDGDDRDCFIYRQAMNAFGLKYMDLKTFPEKLGFLQKRLRSNAPYIDMLFIDYGGGGYELGGMLKEKGMGDRVRVINFGATALKSGIYNNKRSEMWGEMRAWLCDEDVQASIPDDDALQADLLAPGFKYDSNTHYVLEKKADIKKRDLPSPDGGDALALTFAEPVFKRDRVMGGQDTSMAKTKYDLFPKRR